MGGGAEIQHRQVRNQKVQCMYVDGSTTVVGGLPWDGVNLSHTYSWGSGTLSQSCNNATLL